MGGMVAGGLGAAGFCAKYETADVLNEFDEIVFIDAAVPDSRVLAEGDNIKRAKTAAGEYRAALHILTPRSANWLPPVVTYSALTGDGIAGLWRNVTDHRAKLTETGEFAARRREQQVKWMWAMLEDRFHLRLATDAKLKSRLPAIEKAVADGTLSPALAVEEIAQALGV